MLIKFQVVICTYHLRSKSLLHNFRLLDFFSISSITAINTYVKNMSISSFFTIHFIENTKYWKQLFWWHFEFRFCEIYIDNCIFDKKWRKNSDHLFSQVGFLKTTLNSFFRILSQICMVGIIFKILCQINRKFIAKHQ